MITEKIGSAKDKIVEVVGNIKERILEIITSIVDWFKELPNKIGYAIGFIAGRIARWVVDTVELVRTSTRDNRNVINFLEIAWENI